MVFYPVGLSLVVLSQTPLLNPYSYPQIEARNYGLFARLVHAGENSCFQQYWEYGGTVIGLTNDTITVRLGNRIPRTFTIAPALLVGDVSLKGGPGTGHRFDAVEVGDVVGLDVMSAGDRVVCHAVGIGRRPGGVIPADENPTGIPEKNRRHHYHNAVQLIEEFVVPNFHRLAYPLVPVGR